VDGWTHHQAATPDGRYVISTHPTRDVVSLLDVEANAIVATIPTGRTPNYAVVSADGTRAYVSNSGAGSITEIDLENRYPLRTLEAGLVPEHMVMGPDGRRLYVANVRAGTVSEVSLDSGRITRRFEVGTKLHGLDIAEDGTRLFATTRADEKLVAIDLSSGEQQAVSLSPDPYHLETIEGTGQVYVSSRKAPLVWVVDQQSLEVVDRFELPAGEGHQMVVVQE
jgi:DNA-binding beta-propeller fold protein YncE